MKSLFDLDKISMSNNITPKNVVEKYRCDDIAIIGVSIKLPVADEIDDFRDILKYKIDCISELSDRRKNHIEAYVKSKGTEPSVFIKGSFLEEIDGFDYSFFKITPNEARLLNPIQRLTLEGIYRALDDAGYANDLIKGSNTGVFIGHMDTDSHIYKDMILENESKTNVDLAVTGNLSSIIPSRISYFLDLKGPSMLIDTACSSSLVALHEACKAINNGDCDKAIVASARVELLPLDSGLRIGMESGSGFVKSFDDNADGTMIGEGVISLILKPLDKAVEDRDNIYAVIKGSAVNQDGATLGITAPNVNAQTEVLIKAWERSRINPEDIGCYESHGTATKIGDVIELNAISKAFERYTRKKQFVAISSVKSNIGHLYHASGLISVVKAIIQLKYKELLPTANFNIPNTKVNIIDSPVYINNDYKKWETIGKKKRTCVVSSFGFSGTNCHVVLEEYPIRKTKTTESLNILALSAINEDKLIDTLKDYYSFIKKSKNLDIKSFCYTSNVYRNKYEKKLAIIFSNIEELEKKLKLLLNAKNVHERILVSFDDSEVYENKEKLVSLAHDFIKNKDVQWTSLYDDKEVRKISVPTYNFNKKSCWVNVKQSSKDVNKFFYGIKWIKESYINPIYSDNIILIRDREKSSEAVADYLRDNNFIFFELIADSYEEFVEQLLAHGVDELISNSSKIIFCMYLSDEYTSTIEKVKIGQKKVLASLLKLVQHLDNLTLNNSPEIVLLSNCALSIENEEILKPELSTMHGFGKIINIEYSNIECKVIDYDLKTDLDIIVSEIFYKSQNYLVVYRDNKRYIEELDILTDAVDSKNNMDFHSEGTYIVTGGLGALGGLCLEYIRERCLGNIIILGRRNFSEEYLSTIEPYKSLKQKAGKVKYYSVDITDYSSLKIVLKQIKELFGNISGVIHSAGLGTSGLISNKTYEQMEEILAPKVYGTWNLIDLLKEDQLDFFLMFSSGLTIIGEYGQAEYVAANTYLDSLASKSFHNITRMITINWPLFKDLGIGEKFRYTNSIFEPINREEVKLILDGVFNRCNSRTIIGKLINNRNNKHTLERLPIKVSSKILENFSDAILIRNKENKSSKDDSESKVSKEYNKDFSMESIQDNLKLICNEILGYDQIGIDVNLLEVGVDSIIFAKLHKEINELYPNIISISQMFIYPTIQSLASYIYDKKRCNEVKPTIEIIETEDKKDISDDISFLLDQVDNGEESLESILDKIDKL